MNALNTPMAPRTISMFCSDIRRSISVEAGS
jgi:hypothetical protein